MQHNYIHLKLSRHSKKIMQVTTLNHLVSEKGGGTSASYLSLSADR